MKIQANPDFGSNSNALVLPQALTTGSTWLISTPHQETLRPQWIKIFVSQPSWSKMSEPQGLNGAHDVD